VMEMVRMLLSRCREGRQSRRNWRESEISV
jgi:hypothetical protein